MSNIKSVAVLGSGTMGAGIAALAADRDCKVLLLDIDKDTVEKGKMKIVNEKKPMLSKPSNIENIATGTFEKDFHKISDYDWICEAVVEKIEIKRKIFNEIENYMNKSSLVSSNTSGIPLKDITKGMHEDFLKSVCITHFFNPVKIMKLCELIPGEKTSKEVIQKLSIFLKDTLEKGVVYGKDTVNFIGNRIGCFFMFKGLHEGKNARKNNISIEKMDALLSKPIGLPPTGLYGLIDLIGLDVMYSVGKNLEFNLPKNDLGRDFVSLPDEELNLYNKGQLGRKTGGGFYRINRTIEDQKLKEVYDLEDNIWKPALRENFNVSYDVMLKDTIEGQFVWNVMGASLLYAADLIPEIADDIVNIDNAMKWGFAWEKGPFEILDILVPEKVVEKCKNLRVKVPKMLEILSNSKNKFFYKEKNEFLNIHGEYQKI